MAADKTFPCDVCGKSFKLKSDLNKHTRIHTGEKPYECDLCKKSFSDRSTLAKHKRIHTGEKPYECDVCKKKFSRSDTLAAHKRIHKGEKLYECEICEKTFSQSSGLASHKRIHTGEKPYSCDICQKSYSQSSHLLEHNKTAAHCKMIKSFNKASSSTFVDCGETIKVEDIKEEINEEESVDGPVSIHEDIFTEVKEEAILHSGDRDNNTVVEHDIDIVEH